MKEIGGILIAFLAVLGFLQLKSCSEKNGREQAMHRIQLEREATQQRSYGSGNVGAIDATKDAAEKIAAAAPLVMEALKECPKPIPPAMITAFWARENNYCPGTPIRQCAVSPKGARGPTQIMPFNIAAYGKPGEDPETLAVGLKLTVRHLCTAKAKGNITLDPASDAAIFRYNADSGYVADIRRFQAQHAPIWASIQSGNGPMIAAGAPSAATLTNSAPHLVDGPAKVRLFPSNPFDGTMKWFSAYYNQRVRSDGTPSGFVTPHKGIDLGCRTSGQAVKSVCSGKVEFAGVTDDGVIDKTTGKKGLSLGGKTVIVVCSDGQYRTGEMHLETIQASVGQSVSVGQVVGGCGTSGNAANGKSGPHVHFKLEKKTASGWEIVSPCAGFPEDTVLDCGGMFAPDTQLGKLNTMTS